MAQQKSHDRSFTLVDRVWPGDYDRQKTAEAIEFYEAIVATSPP